MPDQAEFTGWSADVERFVNSLVAAAFDVDLQTVATAQAVQTAELRATLEVAERELAAGNFKTSLSSSCEALKDARHRWVKERTDAIGRGKPKPAPMQDITAAHIREAMDRMEDLAEVETFASDVGEYIWLKSLQRHLWEDIPVERDDAERALAFVVGWVLRWEAFSHRYTMDRPGRWRRSRRPQTTTDDPPGRERCRVGQHSRARVRRMTCARRSITITLVDIPDRGAEAWLVCSGRSWSPHGHVRAPAGRAGGGSVGNR